MPLFNLMSHIFIESNTTDSEPKDIQGSQAWGMVAHDCNPTTLVEAGGLL